VCREFSFFLLTTWALGWGVCLPFVISFWVESDDLNFLLSTDYYYTDGSK
jgi:hypothetical protein